MDRRTDGQTNRGVDGRTNGWTNGWTDGWTDGRTDGRTDGLILKLIDQMMRSKKFSSIQQNLINHDIKALFVFWKGSEKAQMS